MAGKKKMTAEQIKEVKLLQANLEMLEKTRQEAIARGKDSSKYIEEAENDVKVQLSKIDPSLVKDAMKKMDNDSFVITKPKQTKSRNIMAEIQEEVSKIEKAQNTVTKSVDSNVQYDIISLPSNGECYESKIGKLPVGYLTAYDENMITSPNLYRDGLVIDLLLRNKIVLEGFDPDELCNGDADAITLFLRATSYGSDFPVTVRDPETNATFDTVIDLTKIKYKEFHLKGDEDGCFSFTLPLSKDEIKFKFLTRKQNKQLDLLSKYDDKANVMTMLQRTTRELKEALKNDSTLNDTEKIAMRESTRKIENWGKKLSDVVDVPFTRSLTNKMEMHIMSVNGETDRDFIHEYVNNMRAKDAMEFRKYISDNEPGVDFNVEVERPEEFGGGSFTTFLEWDDTVFLNLT